MNRYPILTNTYSSTAYEFSRARMRARWHAFWAAVTGRDFKLPVFPAAHRGHSNRKYLGLKTVQASQIIGTLNRTSDFDNAFRPLGKHLLQRWVKAYLSLKRDSWSPIHVHKIGNQLYVEDGHHRVSVARSMGMMYIEAFVWEYSKDLQPSTDCPSRAYATRDCVNACAAD